jgi:hypothetical protein
MLAVTVDATGCAFDPPDERRTVVRLKEPGVDAFVAFGTNALGKRRPVNLFLVRHLLDGMCRVTICARGRGPVPVDALSVHALREIAELITLVAVQAFHRSDLRLVGELGGFEPFMTPYTAQRTVG